MVVPYQEKETGKKQQVEEMFDNISGKYDFLNRLLSGRTDVRWRKKALKNLKGRKLNHVLDVATGTGDLAFECLNRLRPDKVTGLDLSAKMLEVAEQKKKRYSGSGDISFVKGDSEALPFAEDTFDAVTVAFGVRNFEDLDKGLNEMNRVLKPGGKVVILEFSMPEGRIMRGLYSFYFKNILPLLGKLISGDTSAYTYLPASVNEFPYGERFLEHLKRNGFKDLKWQKLSLGISSIYTGIK